MMIPAKTDRQMANQIEQCLDNCQDAYRKCAETITHCGLMVANAAETVKV